MPSKASILLKVDPATHAGALEAARRHGRSMNVTLGAVIERWLAQGAPDPFAPADIQQPEAPVPEAEVIDTAAREVIGSLAREVEELRLEVEALRIQFRSEWLSTTPPTAKDFDRSEQLSRSFASAAARARKKSASSQESRAEAGAFLDP